MQRDLDTLRALDRLLDEALALPPDRRAAWIDTLAGDDSRRAPLLRELLLGAAAARTDDWLARGPSLRPSTGAEAAPADADFAAGERVGPWRLLRPLGRGGMGEVWLAERADGRLARTVALKLPHVVSRSRGIAERYARERDILASLAHPNIARLYDAGVADDGQPWLAMEAVDGEPITAWCDARALGVEARVALFGQVLRAVQHAHANLVVHRDLKPSNVLVTAAGEVRLLDFGIAKLLTGPAADATEVTLVAGRPLTLAYASPEQVTGAPISIASDVYSLGVLLYELLAGVRPYRTEDGARAALERAIVETDPPRASTVATDVAAKARGLVRARDLARALAGDLDTVLEKALSKRPDRRYETAAAFAEDLARHLAGEPIRARGVGAWHRARRLAARHRIAFATTAAIATTLVAGTSVALWQAGEARREAARAGAVQSFLVDLFRANTAEQDDPLRARRTTARELLDRGARRLGALDGAPAAQEAIAATLQRLHMELGLGSEAAELGDRRLAAARALWRDDDPRLVEALLDAAESHARRDPTPVETIETLLAEARALLDRVGDRESLPRARLERLTSGVALQRDNARALASARASVDMHRARHPDDAGHVQALIALSLALTQSGDWSGGRDAALDALAVARAQRMPAFRLLEPLMLAGEVHSMLGDIAPADALLAEAHALTHEVQGPRHPTTLTVRRVLFRHYAWTSRTAEADRLAASFMEDLLASDSGREPALVQESRRILVELHLRRGRLREAARLVDDAFAAYGSAPPIDFERADFEIQRAMVGLARGDLAGSERSLATAADIGKVLGLGPKSRLFAEITLEQAHLQTLTARPAGAIEALEAALALRPAGEIGHASLRARIHAALSRAETQRGRPGAGEALARDALAQLPAASRPYLAQEVVLADLALGDALAARADCAGAAMPYAEAVALLRALHVPDSPWLGEALAKEATCLARTGHVAAARPLAAEARRIRTGAGPLNASMTRAYLDAEGALGAGPSPVAAR